MAYERLTGNRFLNGVLTMGASEIGRLANGDHIYVKEMKRKDEKKRLKKLLKEITDEEINNE